MSVTSTGSAWIRWSTPASRITGLHAMKLPVREKILVLSHKYEHTEWKGKSEKYRALKIVYLLKHCYKAQLILQSCDVNPPLMLASPLLAFSLCHLKFFSLSSSPYEKPSSCGVLDEPCVSLCYSFPTFLISYSGNIINVNSSIRVTLRAIFKSQDHWQPCFVFIYVYLIIYLSITDQYQRNWSLNLNQLNVTHLSSSELSWTQLVYSARLNSGSSEISRTKTN